MNTRTLGLLVGIAIISAAASVLYCLFGLLVGWDHVYVVSILTSAGAAAYWFRRWGTDERLACKLAATAAVALSGLIGGLASRGLTMQPDIVASGAAKSD